MNALPCISSSADHLAYVLGEEQALQDSIEDCALKLIPEYRQDLANIHEGISNFSCRPLGKMIDILVLIRDAKDDAELGRLVRTAAMEEVDEMAWAQAEKEMSP